MKNKKVFLAATALIVIALIVASFLLFKSPPPHRQTTGAEGMVWIEGGSFMMGSALFPDAQPVHRVELAGFWIDPTPVTNADFERFVIETGYISFAERKPAAADFPGVPESMLVPGSLVFSPPTDEQRVRGVRSWWRYVPGANWRHPEGPDSSYKNVMDHPVLHIAWEDAVAYAQWAGKRLPTEAEWEYAARGGLEGKEFVWGSEKLIRGKRQSNTFQGQFPGNNSLEDGYATTSPVGSFPANGYGLYDMSGNVWEWTADWYRPDTYAARVQSGAAIRNPSGPDSSFDPAEPGLPKRVIKGGSFLCTDSYCARYRPGARSKTTIDSSAQHIGFRLVKDADISEKD